MTAGSLWESISAAGRPSARLHGTRTAVDLADLAHASSLGGRLEELRDRNVLLATKSQLAAALALIELDGVARRIVLCAPDLPAQHLPAVIRGAAADACVRDEAGPAVAGLGLATCVTAEPQLLRGEVPRRRSRATEWVLLTSGTTGAPKLVLHSLASLTSALAGAQRPAPGSVLWSTFYDIRRYGGLAIFMRAVHSGSMVLSDASEPVIDFLSRAAAAGVTHISGTPSHWRRAIMSGAARTIAPQYVRLSGEIADQAVLDALRSTYPAATVAHAFASTEAGVAFEVRDGLAGFPAALLVASGPLELKVAEDTLRIRSAGTAERYLGENVEPIRGPDGFVDTGDLLEERAGRYHFMGRRGGVINVGGLKVYPEEIEAVINTHPWVRMSLVKARRNAITGSVVTAEVVLTEDRQGARPAAEALTRELAESCRRSLAPHKVPAMIRIVPSLELSPSGKLVRPIA
ncbi:MAG TPA: AMP-binding protein [Steroidobacteraceae bacterium]|jgi:acyl-coenzyme A synthetase/AMP-(fatty) acid ligase